MGDPAIRQQPTMVQQRLLNGVVATGRTTRIPVHGNGKHSLQVAGITTATVHLERSNLPDPDLATDAHWESLGNVTADGFIDAVEKGALWLAVNVSAWTEGAIDADVVSSP